MADYFSEYSNFIGSKSLPSPAGTPYETPDYIRSKRSSRATAASSREQSTSPPPLPPDADDVIQSRSRDGKYGALDPRRFTPTLHASLVSEILSLRREIDSKNHLVENLETSLADVKNENETLNVQLAKTSSDVRKAKQQVQQMETGTYDAVDALAKERDLAVSNAEELRSKLEAAQKTTRRQDEDAERTQRIWEAEKESWDGERRELERRVHVTESRLRAVVQEMTSQQGLVDGETGVMNDYDENQFKDSGLGNESDAGSIRSAASITKHRRNTSSISLRHKSMHDSAASRAIATPDAHSRPGHSLADELDIEEEDEYDLDDFEHHGEELDLEYSEERRRAIESRQSLHADPDSKAKRVLGLTSDMIDSQPPSSAPPEMSHNQTSVIYGLETVKELEQHTKRQSAASNGPVARSVRYVDSGFQPSPPPSPTREQAHGAAMSMPIPSIHEPSVNKAVVPIRATDHQPALEIADKSITTPLSPPETPVKDTSAAGDTVPITASTYSSVSTQTEYQRHESRQKHYKHQSRDSLSPPDYVPSIAIHPSSRPSSPRPYVLPPGTKNASTQARLPRPSRDAAVQTEEIRVDTRPVKLPPHLLPGYLLPSPELPERATSRLLKRSSGAGMPKISTKATRSVPTSTVVSPQESSPEKVPRDNSSKDMRAMPLRAIPLPRPILSPVLAQGDAFGEGPLNRSSQYGVTRPAELISSSLAMDRDPELSDTDTPTIAGFDAQDLGGILPGIIRPPHGRFGLSEPPKAVPEDKEISPERRPSTSGSPGAAPGPSISSSRANSTNSRPNAGRLSSYKHLRSRSNSFGSRASSSYSVQSAAPPFPIPNRSSSRVNGNAHSEGAPSPTPNYSYSDVFGTRSQRYSNARNSKQASLRKVQSAVAIRPVARRTSPVKGRRRRRSPDLTPVQSMVIESPAPTQFPIPELPTPLQTGPSFNHFKGAASLDEAAPARRESEDTNLVDAIAATMVGEWMWKYIRRKKSFGVQEDFSIAEDGTIDISASSTRHKRWVWLSPYERTIMWDSKQPINNTALLGKKGRKLPIQSVLDVLDQTALPRNPELNSAYSRSIIVLAPTRALKFTAVSAERHALWMTALSFLAQSGRLPSQIPPLPSEIPQAQPHQHSRTPPPIPDMDGAVVKRHRSPSFGRLTVRDSIRLAKGKRPDIPKSRLEAIAGPSAGGTGETQQQQDDSADFPAVPRLYVGTTRHQRKRSNSAVPRLPTTFNGFRSSSSTAIASYATAGLHPTSNNNSSTFFRSNISLHPSSKSGSRHDSMAGGGSTEHHHHHHHHHQHPNFFEAVGTVRMEAFVDPNVRDGILYVPAPPPGIGGSPDVARRRRGSSHASQMSMERRRGGHVFDDPFRSFDFSAGYEIPAR